MTDEENENEIEHQNSMLKQALKHEEAKRVQKDETIRQLRNMIVQLEINQQRTMPAREYSNIDFAVSPLRPTS